MVPVPSQLLALLCFLIRLSPSVDKWLDCLQQSEEALTRLTVSSPVRACNYLKQVQALPR